MRLVRHFSNTSTDRTYMIGLDHEVRRVQMQRYGRWNNWFGLAIICWSVGMASVSCQTTTPSSESGKQSADVRILNRIGRATNRYRNAMELTSYAQSAAERSLAERHWEIHRDLLKLEFARGRFEIASMGAGGVEKNKRQVEQTQSVEAKNDAGGAVIDADVKKAMERVATAEKSLKTAGSEREAQKAQVLLLQAQQALEIANGRMELYQSNLRMADLPKGDSDEASDGVKPLLDRITSLEKESLGDEATQKAALKWGDQTNGSGDGLMDAFRSWWRQYDKGRVLDTTAERAIRMSESIEKTQAENQKEVEQLLEENLRLNEEIQILYGRSNELLKQQGKEDEMKKLLGEANEKMRQSRLSSRRRVAAGSLSLIFRRQASLATEDEGRLASWNQLVASSRARALNRLLRQLGSVLGMILAVFVIAYFVKKIPRRFVKEEKSAYYFRKLISFVSWLVVILILIFHSVGELGSISAVVGLAGAGLAIALQDPIVSLVGWFLVVGKYGISVGDRVEINGVKGDVADVGMLRIAVLEVGNWLSGEQITGRMVFFPNSFIFRGHFFNYSTTNSFIWDEIHILVTYESQWKKAYAIILKSAEEASRDIVEKARESQEQLSRRFHLSLGSPEPYAFVNIADSGVDLVLRYLSEIKLRRITRDRICREILEAFEKETDIELAYPTQRQLTETRIISDNGPAGDDRHGVLSS
jgi:small-conductance mechanosensitive channel